jgi:hypothetical protein
MRLGAPVLELRFYRQSPSAKGHASFSTAKRFNSTA